jgi:hypothetical protein
MFLSRLLPEAGQNADDRLCIRRNLFRLSVTETSCADITYMMFQSLNQNTNCVEQCHLCLHIVDLLDEIQQLRHCSLNIWQELLWTELPIIYYILELSSGSNPDNLVVTGVIGIEQMLEYLINQGSVFCRDFDCDPLTEKDGNTTAQNVESGLLLLHLHNDCVGQEGIKVEVLLQDCSSQSYRCVYRVLE